MEYITEELSRYSLSTTPSEDDAAATRTKTYSLMSPTTATPESCKDRVKTSVVDKNVPKVVRYMNTYRLESKSPFNVESVQHVLQEVLTKELAEAHYEPGNMTRMCVSIAADIRARVKQLNFERYKFICLVQIVERHQQSVLSAAKFLWDADRDRFAVFSFSNFHIAAMACVFSLYYD